MRVRRLLAIVQADVLIRFRRPSTLVVFLILSSLAYLWVPDPASGNALMVVDGGRRALYNSAATGLATATLATLFVGLIGFYAVSNAIDRDVRTRCGLIIASTTMSSTEYVLGKLCGNLVFLATFTAGFMASSMAMLVMRAEAALDPWLFAQQYAMLVPPAIVCAAVLALVFESVPLLSGRTGDVLYFVLWLGCFSFVLLLTMSGVDPGPARFFDYGGQGFVFEQLRLHTQSLSLGGEFDPAAPLFVFEGLRLEGSAWLFRLGSVVTPLPLLAIALYAFHRFDPARVQSGIRAEARGWLARLNAACSPVTRLLPQLPPSSSPSPSLMRSALTEARLALGAYPAVLLVIPVVAIASIANSAPALMAGVLPMAFAIGGVFIADLSSRERRAGTLGLIYAAPMLQRWFVWWKLIAATLVLLVFVAIALLRVAVETPQAVPPLVAGVLFVAALATALGVLSGTPKAFVILFLIFMYVVINDKGGEPALDFAGFYGTATPRITMTYAAVALGALLVAQIAHSVRRIRT